MPASKKLPISNTPKNSHIDEIKDGKRKSKKKLPKDLKDEASSHDLDDSMNEFENVKKRKSSSKRRNKLSLNGDESSKDKSNMNQSTIVSFCLKSPSSPNKVLEVSKNLVENVVIDEGSKSNKKSKVKGLLNTEGGTNVQKCSLESTNEQTSVKNAFQFMMNSRFKVIGQNLSGKELTQEEKNGDLAKSKEDILSKKAYLQEWADKKGAKKRKIEYEEKGLIIEKKLKTRAKRLKKLLVENNTPSEAVVSDSLDNSQVFAKKRKLQVIESDVESTCDSILNEGPSEVATFDETDQGANKQNESGVFINSSCKEKEDNHTFEGILKKNDVLNGLQDNTSEVAAVKTKKQSKLKLKKEDESNEEGSNLAGLTTVNVKNWKMRIKIKLDENKDNESEVNNVVVVKKDPKISDAYDSDSNEPLAFKKYFKGLKKDKIVKVAPLFMKAKAKLNSETLKARKKFLYSEMPNSLRKVVEKEKVEESHYQHFPTISHVTIKPTLQQLEESLVNFWNLPLSNLKLLNLQVALPIVSPAVLKFVSNCVTINNHEMQLKSKKGNRKKELKKLKTENPNYPVYKTFKYLNKKLTNCQENSEIATENPTSTDTTLFQDKLWTDFYKPNCSEEIFGNITSVSKLKSWLQEWLQLASLETDSQKRRNNSDSNSDFEDSNDSYKSTKNCNNTLILHGPHGSGKTMAVYAICNELGINVIEVNASSKRTGKRLLNDLQEATQSHQVQKNPLNGFLIKDNSQTSNSQNSDQSIASSQQMCLLLIEDVDIIFDQDENFISALLELISTSKRPLILTTTDKNCLHLKRFMSGHTVVNFIKLDPKNCAVWLQVLSLVEGLCVEKDDLLNMLDKNNNDIRSTLLELQFWLQSESTKVEPLEVEAADESSNKSCLSDDSSEDTNSKTSNELKVEPIKISKPINLGRIWWELPPLFSQNKLLNSDNDGETNLLQETKNNETSLEIIKNYANVLDSLALVDVWHTKLNLNCDLEPIHRLKTNIVKDSLSLRESSNSFCTGQDLCYDHSYFLLSKHLNLVQQSTGSNSSIKSLDLISNVKRWRRNQNNNSQLLIDVIASENNLNRRAVYLDYLTSLRQIARSENLRSLSCTKRNNRFYNYLRSLGINLNDEIIKSICKVLECT